MKRFRDWFKLVRPDYKSGCWEWAGSRDSLWYGKFHGPGKNTLAHRASFLFHYGDIPTSMSVLHGCDNPSCVNPAHLRAGTHQENIAERNAKCRARGGSRSGEDHAGSKLTWAAVSEIRALCAKRVPQSQIAKRYGIAQGTVSDINRNKSWSIK